MINIKKEMKSVMKGQEKCDRNVGQEIYIVEMGMHSRNGYRNWESWNGNAGMV